MKGGNGHGHGHGGFPPGASQGPPAAAQAVRVPWPSLSEPTSREITGLVASGTVETRPVGLFTGDGDAPASPAPRVPVQPLVAVEAMAIQVGFALQPDGSFLVQASAIIPAPCLEKPTAGARLLAGVNPQVAAQAALEALGIVGLGVAEAGIRVRFLVPAGVLKTGPVDVE